jgi:CheY-like chemotaxis protein
MESAVILVVDDEPHILDNLSDLLDLEGYSVETATDGREALDRLEDIHPHLILCDMMMPHVDGWEVLRHVRSSDKLSAVPFIFLTASAEPSTREQAHVEAVDGFITKPFRVDELLDTVAAHLSKS